MFDIEKLIGVITEIGKIEGRDGIYLEKVFFNTETDLTLVGQFNTSKGDKNFEMNFKGIIFLSTIELDFDKRTQIDSLAIVEDSEKIKQFKLRDHSSKINDRHRHYYVRTYDTVFEIVSDRFELILKP